MKNINIVLCLLATVLIVSVADSEKSDDKKGKGTTVDEEKVEYAKGSVCQYCEYCEVNTSLLY